VNWSESLGKGAQLGLTFYVNEAVNPVLDKLFDPIPVIAPDMITLILSGLVVVLGSNALLAFPRLNFRWRDPALRVDAGPEISLVHPGTDRTVMDLEVDLTGTSLLARIIRWALRRPGTRAQVTLSPPNVVLLRRELQSAGGVVVNTGDIQFPFPSDHLTYAAISAEVASSAPLSTTAVTLRYAIEASGWRSVVARFLVVKTENTKTLQVIRMP
jgi:hypothetical protein